MLSAKDGGDAASPLVLHASSVAYDGRALLILGAAGSGKSSLALQLLALGADLIADDRTIITLTAGKPMASCPASIKGRVEAWGLGILHAHPVDRAEIVAAVDMNHTESDRMPQVRNFQLFQTNVPLYHKVESPYFAAALLQYLKAGAERTLP